MGVGATGLESTEHAGGGTVGGGWQLIAAVFGFVFVEIYAQHSPRLVSRCPRARPALARPALLWPPLASTRSSPLSGSVSTAPCGPSLS